MTSPRISHPPRAVRRAHLDNLALLPGSMLPQIEELHRIAHDLPDGVMLVIEPEEGHPQRGIYEKVVPMLRAAGYRVEVRETSQVAQRARPGRLVQETLF